MMVLSSVITSPSLSADSKETKEPKFTERNTKWGYNKKCHSRARLLKLILENIKAEEIDSGNKDE